MFSAEICIEIQVQLEVDNDVIYSVAVDNAGMDVCVKFDDSVEQTNIHGRSLSK